MTTVSAEFSTIVNDFVRDMTSTFPEFSMIINKWWKNGTNVEYLYRYCIEYYPDKFVDILYKSDDLFLHTNPTEFLPGVSFSHIWNYDDISEKNREMIWNYLQMIMISIVGDIRQQQKELCQDNDEEDKETSISATTSELLKTFDSDDFNEKLKETITSLQENLQQNQQPLENGKEIEKEQTKENETHKEEEDPFASLMDTKLANLAKEIAVETTENFKDGMENVTDVNGVFEHIFKDPSKLMSIVKNVGDKLDVKMKNGEFNEKDILGEAVTLMSKMKNMPGMENIQSMMKNIQQPSRNSKPLRQKKGSNKDDAYLNKLYDQMLKQQQETAHIQKQY